MPIKRYSGEKPCSKCGDLTLANERRRQGAGCVSSYCKPCDKEREAGRVRGPRTKTAEVYGAPVTTPTSADAAQLNVAFSGSETIRAGEFVYITTPRGTSGIGTAPIGVALHNTPRAHAVTPGTGPLPTVAEVTPTAPLVIAPAAPPSDVTGKLLAEATIESARLKRQLEEARASNRALSELADRLSREAESRAAVAEAALHLSPSGPRIDARDSAAPNPTPSRTGRPRRAGTFVALASDWHVEETVTLEATNGLNEYSLDIAANRIRQFSRGISDLFDFHSNLFSIDKVVLGMLGDFLTGNIHPENIETQAVGPIETIAWLQRAIGEVIDTILLDCQLSAPESLVIPFAWGNHGRLTKRTHISTNAQNNLEFLIAEFVKQRYRNDPRVVVLAPRANINYVRLYDNRWTLRFTHLDQFKYQGGVGGLTIPLFKAIAGWDKGIHADVTCGGHWHQYLDLPNAVVNGSLIGYNPYAEWIRASPEDPKQATFMIDKKHGKCLATPIWIKRSSETR